MGKGIKLDPYLTPHLKNKFMSVILAIQEAEIRRIAV
jgi:hypothetical protein